MFCCSCHFFIFYYFVRILCDVIFLTWIKVEKKERKNEKPCVFYVGWSAWGTPFTLHIYLSFIGHIKVTWCIFRLLCCRFSGDAGSQSANRGLVWAGFMPTLLLWAADLHLTGLGVWRPVFDLVACCPLCALQPGTGCTALSWALYQQIWIIPETQKSIHTFCVLNSYASCYAFHFGKSEQDLNAKAWTHLPPCWLKQCTQPSGAAQYSKELHAGHLLPRVNMRHSSAAGLFFNSWGVSRWKVSCSSDADVKKWGTSAQNTCLLQQDLVFVKTKYFHEMLTYFCIVKKSYFKYLINKREFQNIRGKGGKLFWNRFMLLQNVKCLFKSETQRRR